MMNSNEISPALETAGTRLPDSLPKNRRILVVDDEPFVRQLNAEMLESAGYLVGMAEDGADAWHALQRNEYDLLVTDDHMPKLTGIELVTKIRTAGVVLPVIMATGTLPDEEFTQHIWLYPFAVLLKPYSFMELLGTVKAILLTKSTNGGGEFMALQPNWECQPQVFGLRLQ